MNSYESLGYTSHTNTTSPHIHYTDITSHTKRTIHYNNGYDKHSTGLRITDPLDHMNDIHIPEGQSLSDLPIHRPLMDYRNQFNELEGNKLQELLSAAQGLCENDRISLIKYGLFELFFIRSIINYNAKQQYWRVPLLNRTAILRLEIMQYFPKNIYYLSRIFLHKIMLEWENDSVILDLCLTQHGLTFYIEIA
ncbi:unnamed protein product [Oppiella nova]|uniref:Uncharacterized protein n=1 Tax=Oppiella nova TaxID=334625 RepID=A0A7R9MF30_9ACAR|nr:unnamed protein product [Oppiella nova]CAG2176069.1 unnamed protein product [Oppiella nova]